MWKKWFPWRFIIKKAAQASGFLDPIQVLAKIQRFAQPSEVAAPVELIRLATVLQARGLMNVQAIQHNLDWVWPYWVDKQFDPHDTSFIPRAFSITHINLTHRNWTAVGLPDLGEYPLVDPRGLLTPFYDSWSIDAWILSEKGEDLLPARSGAAKQRWDMKEGVDILTQIKEGDAELKTHVTMKMETDQPRCVMAVEGMASSPSWLVISVRPFNPEGVCEVEHISLLDKAPGWSVNKKKNVFFSETPERHFFSNYQEGDVYQKVKMAIPMPQAYSAETEVKCNAGMATAAAVFRIPSTGSRKIEVQIPIEGKGAGRWDEALKGHCELQIGDPQLQYLYETSLRTLILHTPGHEAYPGPYTYKHFWFRDAGFITHALLVAGLIGRVEKILDYFPTRQNHNGHFRSQDGEWDSNGQVLWIYRRFCELTGKPPKVAWKDSIHKGTKWIEHKRLSENLDAPHAGLLPAGFSAEHLGPNDFYYWDDFWGVEGLLSASQLMKWYQEDDQALHYEKEAGRFMNCIEKSLARDAKRLGTLSMPSSPYRRLDTGSIGSLAIGYPLTLWAPGDPRVMATVNDLLKKHFVNGGFFHDMSHSGINPYLTLAIAQILLRNGDMRFADLMRSVQKLATQTGQWPEAIHPHTLGGCMGDGQHVWAAAEWILMVRNCFVREEKDYLILGAGVLPEWVAEGQKIHFGKTPTTFGPVNLWITGHKEDIEIRWEAEWFHGAPQIEIRLPEMKSMNISGVEKKAVVPRKGST